MKYDIIHTGTVVDIVDKRIDVAIIAESACGSCKVKSLCGMSEDEEKVISVFENAPWNYKVNDEVIVGIGTTMGMKAVWWAYMAPFLLMLVSLFVCKDFGLDDTATGLITLGVAAVYFTSLFLMRKKLEREIVFKITKIPNK